MSSTNSASNSSAMSICIPRAFENITEARVAKVFEALNIFEIARIDMVKRVNEKGEKFQRIFVHIKDWFKTADALKARERLLAGKELKIVYDDPWFWKVSLNTWAPKPKTPVVAYDRKPKIRIDFDEEDNRQKNSDAAASLLSEPIRKEDNRPYRERRVDPVYCEQDVKQGFRDRREPRDRESRDREPRDNRDSREYQRPRDQRDSREYQKPRDERYQKQYPRDQRPRDDKYSQNKYPARYTEPISERDHRDGWGAMVYPTVEEQTIDVPTNAVVEQVVVQAVSQKPEDTNPEPAYSLKTVRPPKTAEQKEAEKKANNQLAVANVY
jgi:hypothetical protein